MNDKTPKPFSPDVQDRTCRALPIGVLVKPIIERIRKALDK